MKKIGIISELNMDNTNYGNKLQAFALNKYLNDAFECEAESTIIDNKMEAKEPTLKGLIKYANKIRKIPRKLKDKVRNIRLKKLNSRKYNFGKRLEACNNFIKNNIKLSNDFINLKNSEQAMQLSKEIPIKLYYMGKYLNGRYKIFFSNSIYIESFLNSSDILLKKSKNESIVQFEQSLNFNILERKDRLVKYSQTAYFENGNYFKPQYQTNRRFYVI